MSITFIFPTPNMEDKDKNIEIAVYKVSRRVLQKWKCFWEHQCWWSFVTLETLGKKQTSPLARKAQTLKGHRSCTAIGSSKMFVFRPESYAAC